MHACYVGYMQPQAISSESSFHDVLWRQHMALPIAIELSVQFGLCVM